jgi:hypothetical protein
MKSEQLETYLKHSNNGEKTMKLGDKVIIEGTGNENLNGKKGKVINYSPKVNIFNEAEYLIALSGKDSIWIGAGELRKVK